MGRLQGKVAIITGASKGLGEADARLFAAEGAQVVLTDIDEANGERVAREIGLSAQFIRQDVRDEDGWKALIASVTAQHGRLDILVNNAGAVEPGTIETATAEDYRCVMAVSADGAGSMVVNSLRHSSAPCMFRYARFGPEPMTAFDPEQTFARSMRRLRLT